jgi:hypothetical protein
MSFGWLFPTLDNDAKEETEDRDGVLIYSGIRNSERQVFRTSYTGLDIDRACSIMLKALEE